MKKKYLVIGGVVLLLGIVWSWYWGGYVATRKDVSCVAVVMEVRARNPITRQIKTFSSPCELPKKLKVINISYPSGTDISAPQ